MLKQFVTTSIPVALLFACTSSLEPTSKDTEDAEKEKAQQIKEAMDSAKAAVFGGKGYFSVDTLRSVHLDGTAFKPDSLRDEETATLVVSDSTGCGISFDFEIKDYYTSLAFQVDGVARFDLDFHTTKSYKEYLPCGLHTYSWTWTRSKQDGIPNSTVKHIRSLDSLQLNYAGDWSFEKGWPGDLGASGWVVNNMYNHQGDFSIWGGYTRDEENKELRIKVPSSVTKLNFYYKFGDASPSLSGPRDSLSLFAANDTVVMGSASILSWPIADYSSAQKYSRVIMPGDSVIVLRLHKAEDAFTKMMVDDIRFYSEAPHAQADAEWNFEDDFYPVEISPTWIVDNKDAYEGEYSLRTRAGSQYDPEFSLAVHGADSLSFWGQCDYGSYVYNNIRVVAAGDTTKFDCGSSWKKFTLGIAGADTVRFIAGVEKDKTLERRVDLIRVW